MYNIIHRIVITHSGDESITLCYYCYSYGYFIFHQYDIIMSKYCVFLQWYDDIHVHTINVFLCGRTIIRLNFNKFLYLNI